MAFAGYMDETTVESIWDTVWDTTRFGNINLRIGQVLNFLVMGNATTEITSTAVKPMLAQISEEILLDLKLAAQANSIIVPWDFITANISKLDWKFYDTYLLKKVREIVNSGATMEFVTRHLPRTTDSNVIP